MPGYTLSGAFVNRGNPVLNTLGVMSIAAAPNTPKY